MKLKPENHLTPGSLLAVLLIFAAIVWLVGSAVQSNREYEKNRRESAEFSEHIRLR